MVLRANQVRLEKGAHDRVAPGTVNVSIVPALPFLLEAELVERGACGKERGELVMRAGDG
jgi:hypothetical protein